MGHQICPPPFNPGRGFKQTRKRSENRYMITGNGWRHNAAAYAIAAGYEHGVATHCYISDDYWTFSPRFLYSNFYLTTSGSGGQEANVGNAVTIEAVSIQVGVGVPIVLTFDGAGSRTIADGDNAWTDGNRAVAIPPRTLVKVTTAWYVPTGYRPGGAQGLRIYFGDRAESGPASLAAKVLSPATISSTLPTNTDVYPVTPNLGVALGWDGRPVVLCAAGTSIEEGAGRARITSGPLGERSHVDYGMTSTKNGALRYPNATWAKGGAVAGGITATSGFKKRKAAIDALGSDLPFTTVLALIGTNDQQSNADTWRSVISVAIAEIKAAWPGASLGVVTFMPRATSTDGFQTVGNQAFSTHWSTWPASNANLVNTFLLAGGTAADFALDIRDHCDNRKGGGTRGKWRSDLLTGFTTTLAANASVGAQTIKLAAPPPVNMTLAIDTGGTIEVRNVYLIGSWTAGGVDVQLSSAASAPLTASHSIGAVVAEAILEDGTHPCDALHAFLGDSFWADAKIAGRFGTMQLAT